MNPTRSLPRRALTGVAALTLSLGGAVGALVTIGSSAAGAATSIGPVDPALSDGATNSLRDVLENQVADGDTVVLEAGATYTLDFCDDVIKSLATTSGDIEIDAAVTIQGNGATIRQTCPDRVLYTQDPITLQDVTITGGDVEGAGGGLFQDSDSPVTLQGVTFTGNTALGTDLGGGGLATSGDVTVTDSTFSDNHETEGGDGGGIKVFSDTGTTTITGSTFTGNTTTGWGAAFEQQGRDADSAAATGYVLQVSGSTFTDNSADSDGGGALDTEDSATVGVENSTFSGNAGGWGGAIGAFGTTTGLEVSGTTFNGNTSADDGGAVHLDGNTEVGSAATSDTSATFVDSTITGNTQGVDGAINVEGTVSLGYVTMTNNSSTGVEPPIKTSSRGARAQLEGENDAANITAEALTSFGTVVAQPVGGPNCEITNGTPTDAGYNFSDDPSCGFTAATSKVVTPNDPGLGPLANNGGPTQTLLPLTGSPLIDAIPLSVCAQVGINVDQRGVSRPQGPGCEIGAVEVEFVAPSPAAIAITPRFTG